MKVGRGEVMQLLSRVLMTAVEQIALHDVPESRIAEQLARETVQRRRCSRDRGGDEYSARMKHATCFRERRLAIMPIDEVVERPKQENHRGRLVACAQRARIAHRGR